MDSLEYEHYCSNCDNDATCFVEETGTMLCETCKTAYAWGVGVTEATFKDIDEWDNEDEQTEQDSPSTEI